MAANPFDQFDEQAAVDDDNPFDQFDETESPAVNTLAQAAPLPVEPPEPDGYGAAIEKKVANTAERWKGIGGGLISMIGDDKGALENLAEPFLEAEKEGRDPGFLDYYKSAFNAVTSGTLLSTLQKQAIDKDSIGGKALAGLSETGRKITEDANAELAANRVETDSLGVELAGDIVGGTIDMLPMLIAGRIGGPSAAGGVFGGQVAGHTYGSSVGEKGRTQGEALNAVKFDMLAEWIPEKFLVIDTLLKPGTSFIKRTINATLGEGAQEALTEILQSAYDDVTLKDMSVKDAIMNIDWERVAKAGAIGAGVGASLAGPAHVLDKVGRGPTYDQTPGEPITPTHKVSGGIDAQPVTKNGIAVPGTFIDATGKIHKDNSAVEQPIIEPSAFDVGPLDAETNMEAIKAEVMGGGVGPAANQGIINAVMGAGPGVTRHDERFAGPAAPGTPQTTAAANQAVIDTTQLEQPLQPVQEPVIAPAEPAAPIVSPEQQIADAREQAHARGITDPIQVNQFVIDRMSGKVEPTAEQINQQAIDEAGEGLTQEEYAGMDPLLQAGVDKIRAAKQKPAQGIVDSAMEQEIVGIDDDGAPIYAAPELSAQEQAQQAASSLDIEVAAHEASTSQLNDLVEPSDAQKEAGNYKKGHTKVQGLDIAIENPAGSKRNPKWPTMKQHYGYIKRTVGADSESTEPHLVEQVDVFVKPDVDIEANNPVFIIDQYDSKGKKFDEHKVMMGFDSIEEATKAYNSNYTKGWKGLKYITEATPEEFKLWLKNGENDVEYSYEPIAEHEARPESTLEDGSFSVKDLITDEGVDLKETSTLSPADLESMPEDQIFPPPPAGKQFAKDMAGDELLTEEQAAARLKGWKEAVANINKTEDHSGEVVISLFDLSGHWSKPWEEAGYQVIKYDIMDGYDITQHPPIDDIAALLGNGYKIKAVLAACPCTSYASSGARWWNDQHDKPSEAWVQKKYGTFAAKYFDSPLDYANTMVATTEFIIEVAQPDFHVLENPVGRIASQNDLPVPTLSFQPNNYGDPYTKETLLWGDFNPDLPTANVEPTDGSKMQSKLSSSQKYERSLTPEGFAYAFFMGQHQHAIPETATPTATPAQPLAKTEKPQGFDKPAIDKLVAEGWEIDYWEAKHIPGAKKPEYVLIHPDDEAGDNPVFISDITQKGMDYADEQLKATSGFTESVSPAPEDIKVDEETDAFLKAGREKEIADSDERPTVARGIFNRLIKKYNDFSYERVNNKPHSHDKLPDGRMIIIDGKLNALDDILPDAVKAFTIVPLDEYTGTAKERETASNKPGYIIKLRNKESYVLDKKLYITQTEKTDKEKELAKKASADNVKSVEINGKKYPVTSYEAASKKFVELGEEIELDGHGAQKTPKIRNKAGKVVARMLDDGSVWPMHGKITEWTGYEKPLYPPWTDKPGKASNMPVSVDSLGGTIIKDRTDDTGTYYKPITITKDGEHYYIDRMMPYGSFQADKSTLYPLSKKQQDQLAASQKEYDAKEAEREQREEDTAKVLSAKARAWAKNEMWKRKHKDYRSEPGEPKSILHLNPRTGGTESWPVTAFEDKEILAELGNTVEEVEQLASGKKLEPTTKPVETGSKSVPEKLDLYQGFLGDNPMVVANRRKTLGKDIKRKTDNKVMPRKELIEELVNDGAEITRTANGNRQLAGKYNEMYLTKTGMDYAEHLIETGAFKAHEAYHPKEAEARDEFNAVWALLPDEVQEGFGYKYDMVTNDGRLEASDDAKVEFIRGIASRVIGGEEFAAKKRQYDMGLYEKGQVIGKGINLNETDTEQDVIVPRETKPAGPAPLGNNYSGFPVYEDENGVRSYVESGVRISQSVGIIPGQGIEVADIDTLYTRAQHEFLTEQEWKDRLPKEPVPDPVPAVALPDHPAFSYTIKTIEKGKKIAKVHIDRDLIYDDAENFGYPKFEPVLEEGDALLEDTQHADLAPGKMQYQPERAKQHEKWINNAVDLGDIAADGTKPVAILMGGGGAAGKGSVLHRLQELGVIRREGFVHVDPDKIKEQIPEYNDIQDAGDYRAASIVHEESSDVAQTIINRSIKENKHMIIDKTMGNEAKGLAQIEELKAAGYDVRVIGVTVDIDEALIRALGRYYEEGRLPVVKDMIEAHIGFNRAYEAYAAAADESMLFDNDKEPVQLAASIRGKLDISNYMLYNLVAGRSNVDGNEKTIREIREHEAAGRELSKRTEGPEPETGGVGEPAGQADTREPAETQGQAAVADSERVDENRPEIQELGTERDQEATEGPGLQPEQARDTADSGPLETTQPENVRGVGEGGAAAPTRAAVTGEDVGRDRPATGERDAVSGREGTGNSELDATLTGSGSLKQKNNYHIEDPKKVVGGGQVARFNKNTGAIELYQTLVEEDRQPTNEEKDTLAGFTGWGSFGQELFQGSWGWPQPGKGWDKRDAWLRDHLGQEEWESAQRSITNAHFTDPPTVMAMWDMVQRMGFTGGRVLEPAMGTGNFFSMMPKELQDRSDLTGIELDEITGGISQMLFPDANISIKGYEKSQTPDNFYDVVIGNWPFQNTAVADRKYNKLKPFLHDYFFLKALDQVRPGGLVVGITSSGTMDKVSKQVRLEMAKKGELVASFRLPTGAFQEYAGTKVVTDIVILKKREAPQGIVSDSWVDVAPWHIRGEKEEPKINQYYHENKEHVIGTVGWGASTRFGKNLVVKRPSNMEQHLNDAVQKVPEGVYEQRGDTKHITYITDHTNDRQGALVHQDKKFYIVEGERLALASDIREYQLKANNPKNKATNKARTDQLTRLIDIRQQYAKVIDLERTADNDTEGSRKQLKAAYDGFIKQYGPLNESYGLTYLKRINDPFYPAIAALEYDTRDKDTPEWKPASILERSTMRRIQSIENPSVTDAYILARNESVTPTLADIAKRASKPEAEVKAELIESGVIFESGAGDIIPHDVYLAGNVRTKLQEAKTLVADGNPQLQRNVDALEKVQPKDTPYHEIEARLGASWVDNDTYADYVTHMLNLNDRDAREVDVTYSTGKWTVRFPAHVNNKSEASTGFGTPHVTFKSLVNHAIRNQSIAVYQSDGHGGSVLNEAGTAEAIERISKIREDFQEWLWSDPERRVRLEKSYNFAHNAWAEPDYDGTFLTMAGMALTKGTRELQLRKHQLDAIWRGIVNRKSLNAHEVGTGKTMTIAGIAVESRRYGIAKKPLVLAHNANSASVAAGMQSMYPGAKILYIDNLDAKTIKTKMMQIANDDWDSIVMPHSLISHLTLTEDTLMAMAAEEIAALEQEAREAAEEDSVTITDEMLDNPEELKKLRSTTAKELVKQRQRILTKIQQDGQRASRPDAISFEDLGIDMILVDEAHEFKKPSIVTKMSMKGLQTQVSDKSLSLQALSRYVRANNGGANIHLFTGTPITNTLTEIYHHMRYLMEEEMKQVDLNYWDGWYNSFASEVTNVELTAAADYENVKRLASFINVPELRRMIGQYMDIVFSDDMPEMQPRRTDSGKTIDDKTLTDKERSFLENGRTEGAHDRPYKKIINDTADMTEAQVEEFRKIQQYASRWRAMGGKDRKKAMSEGAPESPIIHEGLAGKASFDVRLLEGIANAGKEGQLADDKDSKASRVVKRVKDVYDSHELATQVIFTNMGTSKTVSRSEGPVGQKRQVRYPSFSTVHDIVARLVESGIPRNEIMIVDGSVSKAKRKEIADKMNKAKLRVVIGSTQTLGTGVNMQHNLRAMHHLDAPWMPGDLEQRNGRGHRQGNQWNTVLEYRYITDRLDGRRWTVLSVKSKFIKEFLQATNENRVIEVDTIEEGKDSDILETLSQASGDPRILIREKLKKDIERLQAKERLHTFAVSDAITQGKRLVDRIEETKTNIKDFTAAVEIINKALENNAGENFTAKVYKKKYTSRKGFDKAIADIIAKTGRSYSDRADKIGNVMGLELVLEQSSYGDPTIAAKVNDVVIRGEKPNIQSLAAKLRSTTKEPAKMVERLAEMERSKERMAQTAVEPFKLTGKMQDTVKALENLDEDMRVNPVPPPAWLRQGAAVNTDIYHNGKKKLVTGHRWNNDGFYVLSDNESIPYMDAKDSQGIDIYEEIPFSAPEVITQPVKDADGNEVQPAPAAVAGPEVVPVMQLSKLGNDIDYAYVLYSREGDDNHSTLVESIAERTMEYQDEEVEYEADNIDMETPEATAVMEEIEKYRTQVARFERGELNQSEMWKVEDAFDLAVRDITGVKIGDEISQAAPVLFSQDSRIKNKPVVSIPRANLDAVVARFKEQYSGAQQVNFIIRDTQEQAFGAGSIEEHGRVKGGFYPGTNNIVLITENITNNRDAMTTLRHEIVAHYGMRQLLNKAGEYDALLDRVDAAKDNELADLYAETQKAYPEIEDSRQLADEVMARAAETKSKPGFFEKIYAQIIKLLQKYGLMRGPVSRKEVNALLELSAQRLRKPFAPVRGAPGAPIFQAGSRRESGDGRTDAELDAEIAAEIVKPLSRAKFFNQYAQHVDIRGRQKDTREENKQAIMADGFKRGGLNALPPYRGGKWSNIVEKNYAPRKGDYVYLAPKGQYSDKDGMRIKEGWKPAPYEVIEASKDYPDMYEEYLRAVEKHNTPAMLKPQAFRKVEPAVYHVTFSKNVAGIKKEGVKPLQTSNWVDGTGDRYNADAGIFSFAHPEDALRWAFKMNWEFKQPVSIVKLKRSKSWKLDPSEDINLQMGEGDALRSTPAVPASDFIESFEFNDLGMNATNVPAIAAKIAGDDSVIYRKADDKPVGSTFGMPDETMFQQAQRYFQNAFNRIGQLQEVIKEEGGKVTYESDVYQAEELASGKTTARLTALDKEHMRPLIDQMAADDISIEELDDFLRARHAPERNDYIASINEDMQDGGSGMTYMEADAIMARLEDKRPALELAAAKVYAVNNLHSSTLVGAGHIDAATVGEWQDRWQFYVPLKGKVEEETGISNKRGQGYSVSGSGVKAAMGRGAGNMSESPTAHAFAQAESAIVRAEKTKIGQALVQLVRDNPDPAFWSISKRTMKRFTDIYGEPFEGYEEAPEGLVQGLDFHRVKHVTKAERALAKEEGRNPIAKVAYKLDPAYRVRDDVFAVMVEGQELLIKVNDAIAAEQLKRLNASQFNWLVSHAGMVNRYLAMVNTALNPEFVITNFERDLQTAMIHLSGEQSNAMAWKVFKSIPAAGRGIWQGTFDTKGDSKWRREYKEMQEEGGTIGFFGLEDIEAKIKRIQSRLDNRKTAFGTVKKGLFNMRDVILDANLAVENSARLAAYVASRDAWVANGMPVKEARAKAASLAKNLTVNFNRKGELGPVINSFYLFYNAAIQGPARILTSLAKSKRTRQIVAGAVAVGFMQAMFNRGFGGDDEDEIPKWDKVSNYDKQMHMIFMVPGMEKPVKWKMPYGYNVFHYAGTAMHDLMFDPRATTQGTAINMLTAILNSWNPLQGADLLDTVIPTVGKPFEQSVRNIDYKESPIVPEFPFDQYDRPESQKAWKSTSSWLKGFTSWMNEVTGGDETHAGWADVSPETVKHYVKWMFGGAGATGTRALTSTIDAITGEEVDTRNIPFVRSAFVGQNTRYDTERFYEAVKQVAAVEAQIKIYKGTDRYSEYKADNSEVHKLAFHALRFKKKIKKLRDKRDKAYANDDNELGRDYGEQIRQQMMVFSKKYDDAIEAQQ